jgi:type IV secretory pathway VirB2 component (pilin)
MRQPRLSRDRAPASPPDGVVKPFPEDGRRNSCEAEAARLNAEATQALAAAVARGAAAIEALAATAQPAVDAIHSLSEAQKKLCAFLVGHRLKLAASIPVVLVGVSAISPNAAQWLHLMLKAWGLVP